MPETLRVALLGVWHVHAAGYAAELMNRRDATLTMVWDEDLDLARQELAQLDMTSVRFVDDLDAVLASEDVDAVMVTTSTATHVQVMRAAARAGKHIFTEKLLAPTVDGCEQIIADAAENGVKLVVSLPRLVEPVILAARALVEEGALGELTYARFRMAHDGWLAGWLPDRFADPVAAVGGAFTDLGCHPIYLTQLFLGSSPAAVTASYSHVTGRDVEDNAVVTLDYPDGAIGVCEASFVTTPGATTLELRGTRGSLLSGFGSGRLIAKGERFDAESWQEVELPADGPSPLDQWLTHINDDTVAEDNLRRAVELTRVVAAANHSAAESRTIEFALSAHTTHPS